MRPLPLLLAAGALADVVLFSSLQKFDGARGGRSQTTQFCAAQAAVSGLNCSQALLLVSYSGDDARDLAVNQTAPVVGPTGVPIAANFSTLFAAQAVLNNTLSGADVLPGAADWWSGTTAVGTEADNNCANWQADDSSCKDSTYGRSDFADTRWVSYQVGACNRAKFLVCVCDNGTPKSSPAPTNSPSRPPTASPSRAPTRKPSASPSRLPTAAPTGAEMILVFPSTTTSNGAFLASQTVAQVAAARCTAPPIPCTTPTTLLLCDASRDAITQVPLDIGLSPVFPVYGPALVEIASNWTNVFAAASGAFQAAGMGTRREWTGCGANGFVSNLGYHCSGWTASAALVKGLIGDPTAANVGYGPSACSATSYGTYCVCGAPFTTRAPSRSPTRAPTKSPTRQEMFLLFSSNAQTNGGFLASQTIAQAAAALCTAPPTPCLSPPTLLISGPNGDAVSAVPLATGVPASAIVAGPNLAQMATSWADLFSEYITFTSFRITYGDYWTGTNSATGTANAATCVNWTSANPIDSGQRGLSGFAGLGISYTSSACDLSTKYVYCVCAAALHTASPTPPTAAPTTTLSPVTTNSPTPPPMIFIYLSSGTYNGASANYYANCDATFGSITCGYFVGYSALPFLSLGTIVGPEQAHNIDSQIGAPSSAPVNSPPTTGNVQFATNWANFIASGPPAGWGIYTGTTGTYWTGSDTTGSWTGANDCSGGNPAGWSSSSGSYSGLTGSTGSSGTSAFSSGSATCNTNQHVLCACYVN